MSLDLANLVRGLGPGINLGNALEAPAEGLWGVTLKKTDFAIIKKAGFSSVRVPICWAAHAAEKERFEIDPAFFKRVDWVVAQAKAQDLKVILDFQNYPELFANPAGHEERFLGLWRQIAERYQHEPPTILFELLNEPHGNFDAAAWNRLLARALAVVRPTNPARLVVIGPVDHNHIRALPDLKLPNDDRGLVVTVHFYDPKPFTHQGAEWDPGTMPWLGTAWRGTTTEKETIDALMAQTAAWGQAQQRPVFLGEFGAYSKADPASRERWTRHVARSAEAHGLPWAYWEYCSGFGAYDPVVKKWRPHLLNALIPNSRSGEARPAKASGYYQRQILRSWKHLVPPDKQVLEVGCGDGGLLRELRPARGFGIDRSPDLIATARSADAGELAQVEYAVADIEAGSLGKTFDYVIIGDGLGHFQDTEQALNNVRSDCGSATKVVLHYQNRRWEPLLRAAARLGMRTPELPVNRLSGSDIEHFAWLSDFEVVARSSQVLLPVHLPVISWLANDCLAAWPGIGRLCLANFLVLRPGAHGHHSPATVSVIIPCRNERGTIEEAVRRLPEFGSALEIIFVNSHSTDGTREEVLRIIAAYPHRTIKLLDQEDRHGKAGAVRLGFAQASHEVLIILDADLTVIPENMPKFYNALVGGKGGLINGVRLVYPLKKDAMRTLNRLGNRFFSWAFSLLLKQTIRDTLCGSKALWRRDYCRIAAGREFLGDLDPFGDFDLLLGAARLNLKIVDLPVRYLPRSYGKTNIHRFRHGWLLLRITWRAFWRLKVDRQTSGD
jgi:SAM-dependent methyltransferase